MKSDTWVGKKGYRYWYYRYRDSQYYVIGTVGVCLIASILLAVFALIPELTRLFSIRQEVEATQAQIAVLQSNITFMNSMSSSDLTNQFAVATNALPPAGNFGLILNTISQAARQSNVSLDEYSFPVGAVSGGKTPASTTQNAVPITVTVVVNGSFSQIKQFINTLEVSLPLSDVISLDGSEANMSIVLQFYQKPFPNLAVSPETPLVPLSAQKTALLQKLSSWQTVSGGNTKIPRSSGSGVPLF